MASPKSFRKHGTFIYQVPETIADYGSTQLVIEAMQKAGMTHAWVRIHGPTPYGAGAKKIIADFIAALKTAGIAVAAWGWCDGSDPTANAKLALKELSFFGLTDYIADIEHGVHGANWTPNEITKFCTLARAGITGGFGITTFPLIDWHEPELMTAALPFVDMFNPQVYWHHFPNKKMLKQFKRPNGTSYTADNAAEYAALCLDRWDRLMGTTPKDIVVTGQAYWGEGEPPFPQTDADDKVDEFLAGFADFNRIIGLNWWHFGGSKCMSHRMLDAITKANLGTKTYKP
jgi:hypothetical protein